MTNQVKKLVITVVSIALMLAIGSIAAAENLRDAKAEATLKKMSEYMAGLKSFSADAYIFDEQIMADGFKLSILRSASVKMQRPDKLYLSLKGMIRNQEVFFNGENLVIYGKNLKMAIEMQFKGDVDAMLDKATDIFSAELPGRDLLSKDVYTPLMDVVTESADLGVIKIGDVACRYLAFRSDEVDFQLWVEEGDRPLPCRYTITSKWTYGAPQYTVTFTNWQVNQKFPDSDFTYTAPEGIQKTTVEKFQKALEQALKQEGKKK